MRTTQQLTPKDIRLDTLVAECEAAARREGWTGPWTLQVGDLDAIILVRRGTLVRYGTLSGKARLTAAEGEYLGISRAYSTHVDWDGVDEVDEGVDEERAESRTP